MTTTLGIPSSQSIVRQRQIVRRKTSFRGPGIDAGLKALGRVAAEIGVPVLTDVHEDTAARRSGRGGRCAANAGVSMRQTNFIVTWRPEQAGQHQEGPVFIGPGDANVVDKARSTGNLKIMSASADFPSATTIGAVHAFVAVDARYGMPGRVRRHPFVQLRAAGATPPRPGEFVPVLALRLLPPALRESS